MTTLSMSSIVKSSVKLAPLNWLTLSCIAKIMLEIKDLPLTSNWTSFFWPFLSENF